MPSVRWNAVIRANNLDAAEYLCTPCILREFVTRGESFTANIDGIPFEVRVNNKTARDADALSAENTELRAQLKVAGLRSSEGPQPRKDEAAMENVPEFGSEYEQMEHHYNRLRTDEYVAHGTVMFANGVVEGLRQAIHAIEAAKQEVEPSAKWSGMNAAVVAIEQAVKLAAARSSDGGGE